jgi:hypothetical protein
MAEQDPTITNVRITNAILGEKLDGLIKNVKEWRSATEILQKDHEDRLRCVEGYKGVWKVMIWVAGIVGVEIIGVIILLTTRQIAIVNVSEALVK